MIRSRCWVVRSRGRSISRSNWDHCSQGGGEKDGGSNEDLMEY